MRLYRTAPENRRPRVSRGGQRLRRSLSGESRGGLGMRDARSGRKSRSSDREMQNAKCLWGIKIRPRQRPWEKRTEVVKPWEKRTGRAAHQGQLSAEATQARTAPLLLSRATGNGRHGFCTPPSPAARASRQARLFLPSPAAFAGQLVGRYFVNHFCRSRLPMPATPARGWLNALHRLRHFKGICKAFKHGL